MANLTRRSVSVLVALGLIVALARSIAGTTVSTTSRTDTMQIQFVHYVQLGIPEQDVFIEPHNGLDAVPTILIDPLRPNEVCHNIPALIESCSVRAQQVMRVEPGDAQSPGQLAKSLYAAETVIPHDLNRSGPNPIGPYWKGDALGVTLRLWLGAEGSGYYVMNAKDAELDLAFQKLVPRAQYALRCMRTPVPVKYDPIEIDCPHWSRLQSRIQPDADGNATLRLKVPMLPKSNRETSTVLQLVYTRWEDDWGGYGKNEHVQLLFEVPIPQD